MEKFGTGLIPSPYDIRDYVLASGSNNYADLPEEFNLGVLKIKDQGYESTCAAHVIAELIEYHNYQVQHKYSEFSTEFIYGAREPDYYLGDGMVLREALKIAQKRGDVYRALLPWNNNVGTAMKNVLRDQERLFKEAYPNRISTYYSIRTDNDLKYALFHNGPVVAGIKMFDNATLNKQNVYKYRADDNFSGHAVLIIGWTHNCWIIQNSWGKFWGDKGVFYLPMSQGFSDVILEAYGVTDDINEVSQPVENSYVKHFYPIINFFMNLKNKIRDKSNDKA